MATRPIEYDRLPATTAKLVDMVLDLTRQQLATERLSLACAALGAKASLQPLAYCDQLRKLALDPLPAEGVDEARKYLEILLAKVEAAAIAGGPGVQPN